MPFGLLKRLWKRNDGIAVIEFALALPVLLSLSLVGFEVASYALLNLKLQHAATAMAELATMDKELPAATLDGMFAAVTQIVSPYAFSDRGVAIVTGVGEPDAVSGPEVSWQRRGGGTLAASSEVGKAGGAATIPSEITMSPSQAVVVAEVVYDYEPILLGFIPKTTLHKVSFYRPRFGTLPSLS